MINAAILGFGVVGSGVAEVLTMNRDLLAKKAGQEITEFAPKANFASGLLQGKRGCHHE